VGRTGEAVAAVAATTGARMSCSAVIMGGPGSSG
jgi:hypothetical protein